MHRLSSNRFLSIFLFNNFTKNLIDGVVGAIALYLAFEARYEGQVPSSSQTQMWILMIPIAIAHTSLNWISGLGRHKWRYITKREASQFVVVHLMVPAVLFLCRFVSPPGHSLRVAIGVITLEYLVFCSAALYLRILWRTTCEKEYSNRENPSPRRILIVGAGFHGATVAQEMIRHKTIHLVGFLDDDPSREKSVIAGVQVLGPISKLPQITKLYQVDEILICVPPSQRASLNLHQSTDNSNPRMRVLPTVEELIEQEPEDDNRMLNLGNGRSSHVVKKLQPAPMENSIEGQKILITGGAGFIGSNLAERLAKKNRLILFDKTFENKPLQFTRLAAHPNVELVTGDILDDACLSKASRDVDMVVHAAAVLGVGKVCSAARETLETNYGGTSRLLHVLESSSQLTRFLYFSTSEVFGVNSYRVGEATPPMMGPIAEARWSYSMAKLAGEHLVQSYFREAKMPTAIVRPFNVFGPRRTGDYALLRFMINAINNHPLEIHGDGSQIRSWCYIEDFCDALIAILERPEAVGQDFNIGNPGNTITVKDLARRVIEIAGSSSSVKFIKNPFPDIQIRVPSLDKAQNLLGYNPRYDLDTALALTVDWHRKHMNFFANMALPNYTSHHKTSPAVA